MKLVRPVWAFICLFAFNAVANDKDQFDYFGFGIQNHSYDDLNFSPGFDSSELAPANYDADSSAFGGRIFLGHQFNRYIAVEAGITSYGEGKFSVKEKVTDAKGNSKNNTLFDGKFTTLAGDLRIIGTYPVSEKMFLRAHLGALLWDNEFEHLTADVSAPLVKKDSDTGISLLTGIGLGYGFNKKVALSLDFESSEIADISMQTLSLSLLVRF